MLLTWTAIVWLAVGTNRLFALPSVVKYAQAMSTITREQRRSNLHHHEDMTTSRSVQANGDVSSIVSSKTSAVPPPLPRIPDGTVTATRLMRSPPSRRPHQAGGEQEKREHDDGVNSAAVVNGLVKCKLMHESKKVILVLLATETIGDLLARATAVYGTQAIAVTDEEEFYIDETVVVGQLALFSSDNARRVLSLNVQLLAEA